jgi:acetate kinase
MNSLVLIPGSSGLRFARVCLQPKVDGADDAFLASDLTGITSSVDSIQAVLAASRDDNPIDVLTIRSVYGGRDFASPVLVDEDTQSRFLASGAQAPLCVAHTASLIEQAHKIFPHIPVALAFETSFFVDLPTRETSYALPSEIGQSIRRWGYHGLFHDAATTQMSRSLGVHKRPLRLLSICLDARPEMAAVLGRTPLLVTSGSTPVEGLPGELNCGEIDPAIPLALAADTSIGPEAANLLLTRESGFFGMLGWPATLGEVLTERRARVARVREHLYYHMALAAGSSLAALEGLDGVVFSGRYAQHGDKVARYLLPRIERALDLPPDSIPWETCSTSLDVIVAEAGMSALLSTKGPYAPTAPVS